MPEERQGNEFPERYAPSEYIPFRSDTLAPRYAAMAPPPARQRRKRWLIVGILVALLLLSIPTFFIVRYITRSTPDNTLDAFCNALQQENYPSAYARFSPRLQHTMPEATFASIFSQDKVNACTHGTTGDAGTSVTNTIKLVHASKGVNNDIVTLTKDSNDSWKIDDIYRQT